MSSSLSRTNKRLGASWPTTSDIKTEEQWRSGEIAAQQGMDKPTSSSAICKQEVEEDLEEEESVEEIELGNSREEDEAMIEENGAPEFKLYTLIHSRELLEKVICPLENMQLLTIQHSKHLATVQNCLVAFRLQKNENEDNLSNGLYIDQINNAKNGEIEFKHLGQFKFNSIQPHNGPIGDEDFEKWLDMLIHAGEELPKIKEPLQRKENLIRRLYSIPQKLFSEMFAGKRPPMVPFYNDISSIILQFSNCNKLLKFYASDFVNIITGLCIQVDITQINHSMKLPPLMNSLKYMLIPISNVTFDEPNPYQLYERPYLSNVLLQTVNENGNVICSSQFLLSQQKRPFPVPSGSGQLIQISLTFWAMNNIPMPTLEHIQRKAAQLRDALKLNYNVQLRKKVKKKYSIILPIGPPPLLQNNQPTKSNNDAEMNLPRGPQQRKGKWTLSETRKGRYTWKWIIKKKKKTKEQKKKSRQKSGEKRKRRRIAKLLAAEEKKRQKMGRQNILSEKTEVPSPSH